MTNKAKIISKIITSTKELVITCQEQSERTNSLVGKETSWIR